MSNCDMATRLLYKQGVRRKELSITAKKTSHNFCLNFYCIFFIKSHILNKVYLGVDVPFITLSQTFKEKYTILYKARDVFLAKRIIFPQIESSFLLTSCICTLHLAIKYIIKVRIFSITKLVFLDNKFSMISYTMKCLSTELIEFIKMCR